MALKSTLFIIVLSILIFILSNIYALEEYHLNIYAIIMFMIFALSTLFITYWASKETKSAKDFYTAKREITGTQNGFALAGDYMSAASFLGISGLIYSQGYDGLIYSIGFLMGWPILLILISEKLRNLGKYTFSDALSFRLSQKPIRILTTLNSITIVIIYLIAQMVGSGKIIEILFGIPYNISISIIGIMMILYVAYGGMLATTWVQIIKAILLLVGTTFLALGVLYYNDFSIPLLLENAVINHPDGIEILEPGRLLNDPISILSLSIALIFGTAGLPHILMRFFSVENSKEARKSVFVATSIIGYFYFIIVIIGYGAIILVCSNPDYINISDGTLIGGNNMAAIHLSHAIGGDMFLGFISAVAFATMLAVISGLALSAASAISHDIYANVIAKKNNNIIERKVSFYSTIIIGIIAIILGIVFEKENIAYMVGLAFAIAASTNFPLLVLSIYWSKLTTKGAVYGGLIGLVTVLLLMILSPLIWVDVFKFENAIFPYEYPALFSVAISFISIIIISLLDKSPKAKEEIERFKIQEIKSHISIN